MDPQETKNEREEAEADEKEKQQEKRMEEEEAEDESKDKGQEGEEGEQGEKGARQEQRPLHSPRLHERTTRAIPKGGKNELPNVHHRHHRNCQSHSRLHDEARRVCRE